MQRLIRWNIGRARDHFIRPDGTWNDLDEGHVSYVDFTIEHLTQISPHLKEALSHNGRVGRIVSYTHEVVQHHRIVTFLIEFP